MRRPPLRALGYSALGLIFVLGAAWAWNSSPINLKDRLIPKHLATVYPGELYRSGQIDARLVGRTLKDLQIGVVVDLTADTGDVDPAQVAERRAVRELGIERINLPLRGDGTGSIDHYVRALTAIAAAEREGKPVLVHCRAGDRRAGGVTAAYQLLVRGEPPERAYRELGRFARGSLSDARVTQFLRSHLREIGTRLVASGVIETLPEPFPQFPPTDGDLDEEMERAVAVPWKGIDSALE